MSGRDSCNFERGPKRRYYTDSPFRLRCGVPAATGWLVGGASQKRCSIPDSLLQIRISILLAVRRPFAVESFVGHKW